jgi:hypothetical protein
MRGHTPNDENDSAASRLSVILTRTSPGRICWPQKILPGLVLVRMTGEFDGVYNPICRTGHMPPAPITMKMGKEAF